MIAVKAEWVEGPLDSMPPYAGNYEQLRDQTLRSLVDAWKQGK